jgi:glyceraldehyde-3-phosphate dehydrogenase (NAD(P))
MADKGTSVSVIGTGTIGEPLIGLLTDMRKELGIDEVRFHKRTPAMEDRTKVQNLVRRGAMFFTDPDRVSGFKELGMEPMMQTEEALKGSDVVIDCTPKGVGHANKVKYYERFKGTAKGFIAQGSESGFGKRYARGINDSALVPGEDQFIQVVSCNTHNLSVIIKSLALSDGDPENLVSGRFVCIRRANDTSQAEGFIASPEVGQHKDPRYGTHHARDAHDLFETLGYDLKLFSSAVKVPTQYMHLVQFDLQLKEATSNHEVLERFRAYPHLALTHKMQANLVYSFGRDHGHFGRILEETVVAVPSLYVSPDGKTVVGYCFTPQDGNSLLSSVSATMFLLYPDDWQDRMTVTDKFRFTEV